MILAMASRGMWRLEVIHSSLFSQKHCTDEAFDGSLVRADDIGAPFDLLVQALQGIGGVQLGSEFLGEGHERQHVGLGNVHESSKLLDLGPEIIGNLAPLQDGGVVIRLRKGGADHGGDHFALALVGMGERVAHEVDPASLPCRAEHLGSHRLQAFVSVGDHQLDAGEPTMVTRASMSLHSRDTWLFEMPDMPIAFTKSSTARVDTPWM